MMTDGELQRYLTRQLDEHRPGRYRYCRDGRRWVMGPAWLLAIMRMTAGNGGRPLWEPAFTPQGSHLLFGIPVAVSDAYGPLLLETWNFTGHAELFIRVLDDRELLGRLYSERPRKGRTP